MSIFCKKGEPAHFVRSPNRYSHCPLLKVYTCKLNGRVSVCVIRQFTRSTRLCCGTWLSLVGRLGPRVVSHSPLTARYLHNGESSFFILRIYHSFITHLRSVYPYSCADQCTLYVSSRLSQRAHCVQAECLLAIRSDPSDVVNGWRRLCDRVSDKLLFSNSFVRLRSLTGLHCGIQSLHYWRSVRISALKTLTCMIYWIVEEMEKNDMTNSKTKFLIAYPLAL